MIRTRGGGRVVALLYGGIVLVGTRVRNIRIYRDRRGGRAASAPHERRISCWMIENCDLSARANCHAYIVGENCWDFWTTRGAKYRGCCHKLDDCRDCSIVQQKFGDELPIYVSIALPPPEIFRPTAMLICEHLQFLGGPMPQGRALRLFLREQLHQDGDAFRCRQRGVHLDPNYVTEVCATRASRECVFI